MVLKTDGELALVQVQEAIADHRGHATILENPPAHDPQSSGEAERAVQEIKCQFRSVKLGLEARIGRGIRAEEPILEWMIPHAAESLNRFSVGKDGRTPYYRTWHRPFTFKVFEFGEQIFAKPKRRRGAVNKRTLDPRWHDVTWLGFNDRSGEHLVAMKAGGPAIKVRTVRQKAEGSRWSREAVEEIKCTPDAPNPRDASQRQPRAERETTGLDFGARGGDVLPRVGTPHPPGLRRNWKIAPDILEAYGYTTDCRGCEAAVEGISRGHTDEC